MHCVFDNERVSVVLQHVWDVVCSGFVLSVVFLVQLQFVMKGDDDTFVRVDRLLNQLDQEKNRQGGLFLGCNMGL